VERRQARAAAAETFSVGDLIASYLRDHAERHQRPRTLIETKRALERHWAPLHGLSVADETRRDVSARLLELARTSGTVGAIRERSKLSSAYVWAIKVGLADMNPVVGTVKGEESSRERVLSAEELAAVWHATAGLSAHDAIVRLLMLTGARKSEVGGMSWVEIDCNRGLWTVPAARYKTKREHEVPLSRQALAIINELPELPRCPFLFGRKGRSPFSGWSRCKTRLDAKIAEQRGAQLSPWALHDLRRSVVSHCAESSIADPHVIEAVVGHARGGVEGVYNRAKLRTAKAAALERWGNWLEATVAGQPVESNVVTMR
jgi:integrase